MSPYRLSADHVFVFFVEHRESDVSGLEMSDGAHALNRRFSSFLAKNVYERRFAAGRSRARDNMRKRSSEKDRPS